MLCSIGYSKPLRPNEGTVLPFRNLSFGPSLLDLTAALRREGLADKFVGSTNETDGCLVTVSGAHARRAFDVGEHDCPESCVIARSPVS